MLFYAYILNKPILNSNYHLFVRLEGQSKYICEDEAFYFTEINPNEKLSIRTTKNGYWKTNGEEEEVIHGNNIVGFKTIWNFFWGRAPNGEISHWRIEEYRLHPSVIPADELSNSMMEKVRTIFLYFRPTFYFFFINISFK